MILNDLAKCLQLLALNLNYSEKIRLIFFWQGLIHSNLTMCFSKPIVGFIFSPNFLWEGKIFRELLKKVSSLLLNHHFISGFEFAFASVFYECRRRSLFDFFLYSSSEILRSAFWRKLRNRKCYGRPRRLFWLDRIPVRSRFFRISCLKLQHSLETKHQFLSKACWVTFKYS